MTRFERFLDGFEKILHHVAGAAQYIAIAVFVFMMLLTTGDVVGRLTVRPIYGTYELTGIGLAILIFFSLGHTQLKKEHIAITFIVDRWPRRAQAILNTVTYLVLFLLVATLTWQMTVQARRLLAGGDITLDLRMPLYLFAYVAAFGLLIFTATLLLEFLKSLLKVVRAGE